MIKKGEGQILGIILMCIIILGVVAFGSWICWCLEDYFQTKDSIKRCNDSFGEGNWTFTQTKDEFSCKYYNQSRFETSSITTIQSKTCYENGVQIIC